MNKYVMQGKLADGGFSSVFKCTNKVGTAHVCKIIPKAKMCSLRVQKEIGALTKLHQCVYVPRLQDVYEDDDAHYIVQEYCRGAQITIDPYDEFAASIIIRELLRGLYELHENCVCHCDIKAGNIIFNKHDNTLKIIDFGNSQLKVPPVKVENLVGTPLYMSPEQLGHTCTFATDVWSVGILLHHMLSGVFPFDSYKEIFTCEPTMRGIKWQGVSADAKNFIAECLHKDYHKRPSVEDLLRHPWIG
jgi:serine/threonine-protein kinase 24/25/MST4